MNAEKIDKSPKIFKIYTLIFLNNGCQSLSSEGPKHVLQTWAKVIKCHIDYEKGTSPLINLEIEINCSNMHSLLHLVHGYKF
ncbi:hypothetical protein BpHYR1_050281 [Brachionus plicatilis]|uniref:Uncharacterized protein n=1 Tax=Brachionus plicatilis TaxID=10195 RepID=A0A3M7QQU9_BRAPC|nr:hypothetical protein BpHYR1_050281 [Brachionus plicatilis]